MIINPKVSIIIPVYNAEAFIERGINSVLNQTYNNIELIIVDDGSKDNTCSLIEKKYGGYNNIIFYKQKNYGVSVARNKGIKLATGDYCIFLDADDWLELDAVETLLRYSSLNKDYFIICDYYKVYMDNGSLYKCENCSSSDCRLTFEESIINFAKFTFQNAGFKLYNLEIIRKYNVKFPEGIHHGEDGVFVFRYLHCIDKVYYLSRCLWNYLLNPYSVSHTEFNSKKITGIRAAELMMEESIKYKRCGKVNKALNKYIFSRILSFSNEYLISSNKNEYYRLFFISKLKKYLKNSLQHNIIGKNELIALAYIFSPKLLSFYLKFIKKYLLGVQSPKMITRLNIDNNSLIEKKG